ncbi:MAG: hypothetical protein NT062_39055, partial [Proteobacteria bacterium]|nr:hypothetical protein [Pseudomonadota bacterium]
QGVWVYQRRGQEVIGYFSGALRGNVLDFKWQEPNNPPLTGAGYLVFDAGGRQYSGKWWSDARDRQGDWNGWRQAPGQDMGQAPQPTQPSPYGGNPYGGRTYGNPNPYAPGPQPQAPQQPQPYGPQAPGPGAQPNPYGPAQPPSR